jgi:hypothetical protein
MPPMAKMVVIAFNGALFGRMTPGFPCERFDRGGDSDHHAAL